MVEEGFASEPVSTSCTFSRLFDGKHNGAAGACGGYGAELPVNARERIDSSIFDLQLSMLHTEVKWYIHP